MMQTCLNCEVLRKEVEELRKEVLELKTETIRLEGWKGKDEVIYIWDPPNNWIVVEHRQDKETHSVDELRHNVPHKNVVGLWRIIKRLSNGEKLTYKQVVASIIMTNRLDVTIDAFNGGKNRALYYFPYYYYPVKILEYKGLVKYGGRGNVTQVASDGGMFEHYYENGK